MALSEREQGLIARIENMKAQGFPASKESLLPHLFVDVYGKLYNKNCPGCEKDGYDALIRWAKKRTSKNTNTKVMGSYKFKHEHRHKRAIFLHRDRRYVVTAENINDETAEILLSFPKYQDWIEPTGETAATIIDIPKAEVPAEPVVLDVTNILVDEPPVIKEESPNVEKSGDASASTSTGQQTGGQKLKGKPGPKPKNK